MIPGYKLVLDVSHHQKIDYKVVAPNIDGVIIRCAFGKDADTAFIRHYEGFMAEGKPAAAYQWFRPDQDVKAQIETAKLLLDQTKINLIFSDQEQHGVYAGGLVIPPYFSGDRLSTLGLSHITGMITHGFKLGTYTRATWISQWAKPMLSWFFNYTQWLASWPFAKGAVTCSWDVLKNTWSPKVFSPYKTADWPAGAPQAQVWQWSGDKFVLPGIYTTSGVARSVDLNYVSDSVFAQFLKSDEPPVVVPQPNTDEVYNELYDLKNSMMQDVNELAFIMGLLKPGV